MVLWIYIRLCFFLIISSFTRIKIQTVIELERIYEKKIHKNLLCILSISSHQHCNIIDLKAEYKF